jgi:hypothetical protein
MLFARRMSDLVQAESMTAAADQASNQLLPQRCLMQVYSKWEQYSSIWSSLCPLYQFKAAALPSGIVSSVGSRLQAAYSFQAQQ